MSFDAFIGIILGSGISVLVTYLTHRWTEKREKQKIEIEREKEAISQIFSPLVFILNRVRDMFASIIALHNTLQEMPDTVEKREEIVTLLSYVTAKRSAQYPQVLEDMLLHKSGLIRSPQFYGDLVVLQSYLDTIVTFIVQIIPKRDKSPSEIKRYLSALAPLVIQLDEAISKLREYSLAKTSRLPGYDYKQFFTMEKYTELESCLDEASRILTGEGVIEWSLLLKRLRKNHDNKDAGLD